jgi:serine/threonine protein kinase
MSTLLATTNIRGGVDGKLSLTDRSARSAQIAQNIKVSTSTDQAVQLLTQMRDGLANRTGRVRLIHTTDANTTMAFENFKSSFRHYRTLETKAALIAYFDKAGLDIGQLNAYLETITTTAGKIQASRIYTILNNALDPGNSQLALVPSGDPQRTQNLIIAAPNQQNDAGIGWDALLQPLQSKKDSSIHVGPQTQQKISQLLHPQAQQNQASNPQIDQQIVSNPVAGEDQSSVHDIDDYDEKGNYIPDRQKLPVPNQPQPPVVSNADLQAGNFAFVPPPTQFTLNEAIENASVDFANKTEIGKGGFGQAYQVNRGGETVVLKVPNVQNVSKFPKVTMISLNGKLRLNRTNEVTAAYLKSDKISNVCIPTDFLVHITRDGKASYEVIPAGQAFKKWALAELQSHPQPTIRIAGSIMPQASGTELFKQIALNKLKPDDLQAIATKSLETLYQFSNHGFVHGDIKPENMIYDTAGKQLTFIDTGGLAKISQQDKALEKHTQFHGSRGVTEFYSHPSTLAGNWVGHEQDFFSMGMTILLTSYITNNRDWRTLDQSIKNWKKSADPAASLRANLRDRVKPTPDSLEDLALRLIEISLEGKDPILPARAKAILHDLDQHAALGGSGLPAVDTDSLKPPRNFTTSKAQVEVHEKERGVWKIDDFKDLGDILSNRVKGESVDLKFRINHHDLEADNLKDHLAEHAEKELNYFASFSPRVNIAKKRQEDFEALADSRKIIVEGPNPMDLTASQALDPDTLNDLNARLQARNLPTLEKLNTAFFPAFLSNQFMDGLLKPGSDQRTALNNFSYTLGGKISQTIRIHEDGAILIEASRTRKADAVVDDGKKIALDPKHSFITEKFTLELRLPQAAPNNPPAAEIRILDASYEVKLCK